MPPRQIHTPFIRRSRMAPMARHLSAIWLLSAAAANAAIVDPNELTWLRAEAKRSGYVSVLVHLHASTFEQLRDSASTLKAVSDTKAVKLLAELGNNVLSNGQWNNGVGQISLYVSDKGLDTLVRTKLAISFFPDSGWKSRTSLIGLDGALDAIEQAVNKQGYADVEVVANVDGLEVDYRPDGKASFRSSTQALNEAALKLTALLHAAKDSEITNRSTLLSGLTPGSVARQLAASPANNLRVTREGLLKLLTSDDVRSLRLVGFSDARATKIDHAALAQAEQTGEADVIVAMRDTYSGGKLTPASIDSLKRSNRAALNALLAHARPGAIASDFSEFGAITARLTAAELRQLVDAKDPRLLSVTLQKPVAVPQLATSTTTMNLQSAWSAGFYGAGQNIIVMDTGVDASHPFFYPNRVVYQACFGTTTTVAGKNYYSKCPNSGAGTLWDSPEGTPNAAVPQPDFADNFEVHGTHVAGIAVGERLPGQGFLRGAAPSASIYAVQVFSQKGELNPLDPEKGQPEAVMFNADLLAALNLAAAKLPVLGNDRPQPFTINMSLGMGYFDRACTDGEYAPMINAIAKLRNAGVPVIAATGNDGYVTAINFPACLPGVIKVASVANDGIGNTRSEFLGMQGANVVNPALFPGETFWLAPGGGKVVVNGVTADTKVISSVPKKKPDYKEYDGLWGTSMAAPHIAGLYAAFKSANPTLSVQAWTNWFRANAAVNINLRDKNGYLGYQWQRVRLPVVKPY